MNFAFISSDLQVVLFVAHFLVFLGISGSAETDSVPSIRRINLPPLGLWPRLEASLCGISLAR
jgi:hypothetical protein